MVCPAPYPYPKNNIFLYREKILGVSGREGGYIGFGLGFWETPGKNDQKVSRSFELFWKS
jgi:hypothetical protein